MRGLVGRPEHRPLPPGLTLDPKTGVISGAVTTAGTYNIAVAGNNGVGIKARTLTTLHGLLSGLPVEAQAQAVAAK